MKNIQWKTLLLSIAIPLGVGGLTALLVPETNTVYETLVQPWFAPPGWVFPIVWTILYLLMGIAAYGVATAPVKKEQKKPAFLLYGIGLLFNFLWTMIFFQLRAENLSFWVLVVILLLGMGTAWLFWKIRSWFGSLMIPYVLWLWFALFLNASINALN